MTVPKSSMLGVPARQQPERGSNVLQAAGTMRSSTVKGEHSPPSPSIISSPSKKSAEQLVLGSSSTKKSQRESRDRLWLGLKPSGFQSTFRRVVEQESTSSTSGPNSPVPPGASSNYGRQTGTSAMSIRAGGLYGRDTAQMSGVVINSSEDEHEAAAPPPVAVAPAQPSRERSISGNFSPREPPATPRLEQPSRGASKKSGGSRLLVGSAANQRSSNQRLSAGGAAAPSSSQGATSSSTTSTPRGSGKVRQLIERGATPRGSSSRTQSQRRGSTLHATASSATRRSGNTPPTPRSPTTGAERTSAASPRQVAGGGRSSGRLMHQSSSVSVSTRSSKGQSSSALPSSRGTALASIPEGGSLPAVDISSIDRRRSQTVCQSVVQKHIRLFNKKISDLSKTRHSDPPGRQADIKKRELEVSGKFFRRAVTAPTSKTLGLSKTSTSSAPGGDLRGSSAASPRPTWQKPAISLRLSSPADTCPMIEEKDDPSSSLEAKLPRQPNASTGTAGEERNASKKHQPSEKRNNSSYPPDAATAGGGQQSSKKGKGISSGNAAKPAEVVLSADRLFRAMDKNQDGRVDGFDVHEWIVVPLCTPNPAASSSTTSTAATTKGVSKVDDASPPQPQYSVIEGSALVESLTSAPSGCFESAVELADMIDERFDTLVAHSTTRELEEAASGLQIAQQMQQGSYGEDSRTKTNDSETGSFPSTEITAETLAAGLRRLGLESNTGSSIADEWLAYTCGRAAQGFSACSSTLRQLLQVH
ncbi:unnamed protein product [Amoebophrya sp. A25]|nr:unnamed protein product [Amoebophrya sp. A25]|eukprot:GSA25T00000496001.1